MTKIKRIMGVIIIILIVVSGVNVSADNYIKSYDFNTVPDNLEYSTSVIDYAGSNVDFAIYTDTNGGGVISPYFVENNVKTYISYTTEIIEGTSLKKLIFSEANEKKIKQYIFDREIGYLIPDGTQTNYSGNYVSFVFSWNMGTTTKQNFILSLSIKSLLDLAIESFYIASWADPLEQNFYNYESINYSLTFDRSNNNKLKIDMPEPDLIFAPTPLYALYEFDNRMTNIYGVTLTYEAQPANYTINRLYTEFSIMELGLFSTTNVILPNLDIDENFQLFEPSICAAFDLSCSAKNLVGEISNAVYKLFDSELLADNINEVINAITTPFEIIPDPGMRSVLMILVTLFPIYIIIVVVKKLS